MSAAYYQERMEADLAEIRRKVKKVSDLVEEQVHKALQAVLTDTDELATQVILGDRQVNRRILELDHLCYTFIVRHAPSAGHLRFVAAVLRFDIALERIGDYADLLGRETVRLSAPPPETIGRDLELMGQQARHALSQALHAFHEGNAELAQTTFGLTDQTDKTFETLLAELLATAERGGRSLKDVFALQRIAYLTKRVADQSENICEQAIFAITGKEKDPKKFRILFVDEDNARASQMAAAYARRAFRESGSYQSAGWNPVAVLDSALVEFMGNQGIDMQQATPTRLDPLVEYPEYFNVVVLLSPGARPHLGEIPYRTSVLEWVLPAQPGMEEDALDSLYQYLAGRIQDLMTTLAGPNAR